jgi:hypothetical protein
LAVIWSYSLLYSYNEVSRIRSFQVIQEIRFAI